MKRQGSKNNSLKLIILNLRIVILILSDGCFVTRLQGGGGVGIVAVPPALGGLLTPTSQPIFQMERAGCLTLTL